MTIAHKPLERPAPAAAPARRPRNREATIRAVLETAQRLFLTKGFDNTSLVDIASETGLSPRGVILHFSSKADIAAELLFRDLRARTQAYANQGAGRDASQAIMAFFAWLAEGDRHMFINFAALWAFSARWSERLEQTAQKVTQELLAPVPAIVKAGIDSGQFRRVDPQFACEMLWLAYLAGLRRAAVQHGVPADGLVYVQRAISLLKS